MFRIRTYTYAFTGTYINSNDLLKLHDFLAIPRVRHAAVTLLYSSRNICKPGFVETLTDNISCNSMYIANNTRNIV